MRIKTISWIIQLSAMGLGSILSPSVMADCSLPCGAEEILDCAASAQDVPLASGKDIYNQVLFQKGGYQGESSLLDGLCKLPTAQLPAGTLTSNLQKIYYCPTSTTAPQSPCVNITGQNYCSDTDTTAPYFSYEAFIAATNVMSQKATQGSGGPFACVGSLKDRYLELTTLLATYAQETSGGSNNPDKSCKLPCRGGFFYRYENQSIAAGTDLCYQTGYYTAPGKNLFYVAGQSPCNTAATCNPAVAPSQQITYTPKTWQVYTAAGTSCQEPPPGLLQFNTDQSPMSTQSFYDKTLSQVIPQNYYAIQLIDPSVLYPGLWIGIGPTQLTAESLYYFYGWYENNILSPSQTSASYYAFTNSYFKDGTLGFIGALWYWMYRINGTNFTTNPPTPNYTIHQMMTTTNPNQQVCHGIGPATILINGGCNDYIVRLSYFNYFASVMDPTGSIGVATPYTSGSFSSVECNTAMASLCTAPS